MSIQGDRAGGTLASTTQGTTIGPCKAVTISLSGTWTGTAALQRYFGGAWVTVMSWTGNVETVVQVAARPVLVRIDFTRSTGSLVYAVEADEGGNAVGQVPGAGLPTGAATAANQTSELALATRPTSVGRLLSAAADTNATVVKASAGTLFGAYGFNANAAARYLKVYNKATAPTVGTDTPVLTLYLPPLSAFAYDIPRGLAFATGIGFGLVTAVADNSTAAVTAADILALNVVYA